MQWISKQFKRPNFQNDITAFNIDSEKAPSPLKFIAQ